MRDRSAACGIERDRSSIPLLVALNLLSCLSRSMSVIADLPLSSFFFPCSPFASEQVGGGCDGPASPSTPSPCGGADPTGLGVAGVTGVGLSGLSFSTPSGLGGRSSSHVRSESRAPPARASAWVLRVGACHRNSARKRAASSWVSLGSTVLKMTSARTWRLAIDPKSSRDKKNLRRQSIGPPRCAASYSPPPFCWCCCCKSLSTARMAKMMGTRAGTPTAATMLDTIPA
mmetsp:Transcript_33015/g.61382  ORF Transcript_33015/g.61382 Transcript_33015/m.61382 type:complete len:230 (+) Transcript_33015:192-881(+)